MNAADFVIRPFAMREASDTEYAAIARFTDQIEAEQRPEDPPMPLDERIRRLQTIPWLVDLAAWAAWHPDTSEIVACAVARVVLEERNQHVVWFVIDVLPAFRRQGLARRLLRGVTHFAADRHRRLLITDTTERIPAGEAFLRRLGAEKGIETHVNQLDLADLDRNLLRRWRERAPERASGFALGLWTGPYPEEEIAAIAGLHGVMNDQPRDNLELEDSRIEPMWLRQVEQSTFASGTERWTYYVRERSTGAFAGFTEVFWHRNRPHLLNQGDTGVFPRYRNRGLGRWLKAAMLEKVLAERPEVRFVRTGNADSNAPMLAINRELGFRPFISQCLWQVATDKVVAYLRQRGA